MNITVSARSLAVASVLILCAGCSAASRQARHLERGERYLEMEAYEEAIIEFTNVLRLDPTHAVANRQLGEAYLKSGNPGPAFVCLRRAAEADPDNADVQIKLGHLYVMGNDPQKGWELGQAVRARDPENFEALLLLVDAARETNQLQEVQQALVANQARFGQEVGYHLAEGNLWARQGNLAAAEQALRAAVAQHADSPRTHLALGLLCQSLDKPAEALAAFQTAAELSPTNSIARVRWAEALFRHGERARARKMLETLTTDYPQFLPGIASAGELALADRNVATAERHTEALLKLRPDHYDGLLLKARLLMVNRNHREAIPILTSLATRNPTVPSVHVLLGQALAADREFEAAMRELKLALDLRPNLAEARLLLAELQILRGNPGEAIAPLEALLKQAPNLPQAYVLLGTAYRMEGRLEEATETFRALVATAPDSAQGQLMLGLVLRQQNRTQEAQNAFENSLVAAPDYVMAAAHLAALQIQEQDVQGAIGRLQDQVERATNAPGLPFLLGAIYRKQGATNEAIAAFQQAIARAPAFAGAYVELSTLYAAGGRAQEALAQVETALQHSPDHLPSLMLAASLEQSAGNLDGARRRYEHILKIAPKHVPAANNLAYLLNEHFNDLEGAYALAAQARELAPKDPFTADTLGWIVYKRGDYPWAVNLLRESLATFKHQPEVQYHLASALVATGAETEAERLLRDAVASQEPFTGRDEAIRLLDLLAAKPADDMDRNALTAMRESLRQAEPTAAVLYRLGLIDERLDGPAAALAQYEAALQLNPKFMPALLASARCHRQLGQLDRARELAVAARDLSPRDPEALHVLGQIAYDQGQHLWAFSLLKEAATQTPNNSGLQLDVGLAAFAVGRLDEAEAAFRESQQQAAPDGAAHRQATTCLSLLPKVVRALPPTEARTRVDNALRDWPTCLPALAANADTLLRAGDKTAAEAALVRLNQQFPSYTLAFAARLALLADRQDGSAETLMIIAQVRDQASNDPDLAEVIGRIYYWSGQCEQATAFLMRLHAAGRVLTPESQYALGLCRLAAGDSSEGTAMLKAVLASAPDHPLAEKARAALAASQP